jgi:hypothetical protein
VVVSPTPNEVVEGVEKADLGKVAFRDELTEVVDEDFLGEVGSEKFTFAAVLASDSMDGAEGEGEAGGLSSDAAFFFFLGFFFFFFWGDRCTSSSSSASSTVAL